MADLFREKAEEWDENQMRQSLSAGIGAAILEHVPLSDQMTVMDFGAGTGLLTAHVTPKVKSVAAVDISAAMLEKLVAKPEFHGKVSAVCQDITREPLDTKFDLIISAMAIHHVEDTTALLKNFSAHLVNGGRIALADLDKEDGTFHPADTEGVYHDGFERDAFQVLLEDSGFADVCFYTAHTIDRDDRQYPIFLVTARKAD